MTQKSYVIIMAEEELSTIFLPKSNNLGNLRLNKDDKRTSSALLPPERHSSVLRGTVLAHDPSHGGKWACECVPSILSLQVTAKDSHFFAAPSKTWGVPHNRKIGSSSRALRGHPRDTHPSNRVTNSIRRSAHGPLEMLHLQISPTAPRHPQKSTCLTPTSRLAPYQCSQQR